MVPFTSIFLSTLVLTDSLFFDHSPSATAFAISTIPSVTHKSNMKSDQQAAKNQASVPAITVSALRIRGGGLSFPTPRFKSTAVASAAATTAPVKMKRVRIAAFDSMRFFLAAAIVLGHFCRFANPSDFVFRLLSQHNVIVGCFFALSGYVTAYTSTEPGERVASAKLLETPKQKWILSRIFGFYPLHLLVLLLFSPVFLYADVRYSGWLVGVWHGVMSVTMTQAWFPMHAEIWNAPTWYLSALAFATAIFPFSLPSMAKMTKPQLRRTTGWLFVVNLLPKLSYFYDFAGTVSLMEGVASPKLFPNVAIFNMLRFNPLLLVAEIFMGAVACRLVMLDDAPGEEPPMPTNALSTAIPLLGMMGLLWARAAGLWEVSDMLVRSVLFVPLFLRFLQSTHRNTVRTTVKDPLVKVLSNRFLVSLGNLTFPIFILHGPIGQVFFKKIIATKLFGGVLKGPEYFTLYLVTVLMSAWLVQETFLQSKAVGDWSKKTVDQLSSWM